uniref:beta-glucosidase n=1 Tax=Leersia perrieri TaxID=77586 RepID=A0A0D9V1F0_9ORYZ
MMQATTAVRGRTERAGGKRAEWTGGLSRRSFPAGFVFGTAASAYQVEGMALKDGRGPNICDAFVKIPGEIANNATADVTVDEYHRYKEDVNIMKSMGFDAYRFSISAGTGKVNWKGVAYYNRFINYMVKIGITPYANLYHYDLPVALEVQYGGLLNRKVVEAFADYADFCFKTFGDRVKNWFSFNEPRVVAALGYDDGRFAPGRCTKCKAGNSATEPYIVAHHLILSHAAAVKRYRQKYQHTQKGRIGILLDFVWYEGLTNSTADQAAAQRSRDFHIGWFLHPIIYGEYPKTLQVIVKERLPKFTPDEVHMDMLQSVIPQLKIQNMICKLVVFLIVRIMNFLIPLASPGAADERNGVLIGNRANSDWLYIVPWGLYKAVTYVKEKYGNPTMFLSENGMDDPGNVTITQGVHDTTRVAYYRSYITKLKEAIDDGANCIGYFAWSLLDNFEWKLGYTSRFGLVYVDFRTLRRYPKMSAHWFRDVVTSKN